jgi:hypothetical protein
MSSSSLIFSPEKPWVERSTIIFFMSGVNSLLLDVTMQADNERQPINYKGRDS